MRATVRSPYAFLNFKIQSGGELHVWIKYQQDFVSFCVVYVLLSPDMCF